MRRTVGIYREHATGRWRVDRRFKGVRIHSTFESKQEAEQWLVMRLSDLRARKLYGDRPRTTFAEAVVKYLAAPEQQAKASLALEETLIETLLPFIGELPLSSVHDDSLGPFVKARLKAGKSHKTINLALALVRRILRLAAYRWRDTVTGKTYIEQAPLLTLLPLKGHQRLPHPITWAQQRRLLPELPEHLARMALFVLNTGVRSDVVCNLRWEWEIRHPDLPFSVFQVPPAHIKGGRSAQSRRDEAYVVLNSVAQDLIDAQRGRHAEFVFVYEHNKHRSGERRTARPTSYVRKQPKPVQAMLNTAWVAACKRAGVPGLHVHDLRHTVGMRLREVGVPERTVQEVLWHSTADRNITRHYSVAQVHELRAALELIREEPARGANKTLRMIAAEARELTRVA